LVFCPPAREPRGRATLNWKLEGVAASA